MLNRIRVFQVGDVHLPTACKKVSHVDDKDPRFPSALKNVVSSRPIKKVFKHLYGALELGNADAIIFMGDLTDFGDLGAYEACARYIARSLQLGTKGILSHVPVSVLPGNHDVDRKLAKRPGLATKFQPLSSVLNAEGIDSLPLLAPKYLSIKKGSFGAKLALLNSCWGCGSPEFIPAEFRDGVAKAIDDAINSGTDDKAARAYYERQFDTPAFSDETITKLSNCTPKADDSSLLIVSAHHNLMPQRQPRLAPYTELVNGGAIRSILQSLGRPALYLHGHIHDDPVELISQPGGHTLVSISAPLASDGYNVIEIVYTKTGAPLSCHITRWRLNSAGVVQPHPTQIISLIGPARRAHDSTLAHFYARLLVLREVYWADLLKEAASIFSDDVEDQTIEALELLSADGRVKIENYDSPNPSWIVGATV